MTAFADSDTFATIYRLTLSTEQTAQVDGLLDLATGAIAAAVGKDDAWADALDPVPRVVKAICMQIAHRVYVNPNANRARTVTTLSYSESNTYYPVSESGIAMTDGELKLAKRALGISGLAAPRVESVLADVFEGYIYSPTIWPAIDWTPP